MSKNRYDRHTLRRQEAEKRNEAWEKLTPQQQLEQLDIRLGKGLGAKKQRRRLSKKLRKS